MLLTAKLFKRWNFCWDFCAAYDLIKPNVIIHYHHYNIQVLLKWSYDSLGQIIVVTKFFLCLRVWRESKMVCVFCIYALLISDKKAVLGLPTHSTNVEYPETDLTTPYQSCLLFACYVPLDGHLYFTNPYILLLFLSQKSL